MPWTDQEARARAEDVEAMLSRVQALDDDQARETALAAIRGVVDLYGEGLFRMVGHATAARTQPSDATIVEALANDELVSHLLLVHDLDVEGRKVPTAGPRGLAVPEFVQLTRARPNKPDTRYKPDTRSSDRSASSLEISCEEHCGLCGTPVASQHRHLLDGTARRILCACRACTLLLDHHGAGGHHYRLIPDRHRLVADFEVSETLWSEIGIPVDVAFFFFDTAVGRIVALYPGAMGVTESQLSMHAWSDLTAVNPVLTEMEPDLEALLVNRIRGAREYRIIPVDTCYALAGVIRQQWRGFTGGDAVWQSIATFFATLEERTTLVRRDGSNVSTPSLREVAI